MNDDLKSAEPSWKNFQEPPTRLARGGDPGSQRASRIEEIITSHAPDTSVEIPQQGVASAAGYDGAFAVSVDGNNFIVNGGMVGGDAQSQTSLGKFQNGFIYVEVTLDGIDGSYTASVKKGTSLPEGTTTRFLKTIAVITDGSIGQSQTGDIVVNVYRNWFAGAAPYYGLSFS